MQKGTRSNPLERRWYGVILIAMCVALWPSWQASAATRAARVNSGRPSKKAAVNVAQILGRYGVRPDQVFTWYGAPCVAQDADVGDAMRPAANIVTKPGPSAESPDKELVAVRGVIRSTFHQSALSVGVPDAVISKMVDVLGWEIDFTSDVHAGDRFRVLYERTADGSPGRILVADYVGQTKTVAGFLYEDDHGEPVYLDPAGHPLENTFLRYPVEFSRITSSFTDSRLHPILNTRRPHLGVDFAAPAGTPVRAVGAGSVRSSGWKGGFGQHIEIDHGNDLVSTYSHLNRIRRTVRPGASVKSGDVIGWVGQTGLATGPHLHFAIFRNETYLNPLTTRWAPPPPAIDRRQFDRVRNMLTAQLRAAFGIPRAASSTMPILLSPVAQARRLGPVSLTI